MKKILILSFELVLAFTLLYRRYDSDTFDLNAFRRLEFDIATACQ